MTALLDGKNVPTLAGDDFKTALRSSLTVGAVKQKE
jgi:hypothetical protein